MAALTTFVPIRISIENLSALFETILLLITSAWIIFEAIERLFFRDVVVNSSAWSFLVMGTSIGVNYTRSRILYRAARKYNSMAIEADALHFSTDIWSSSVVVIGLAGVALGRLLPDFAWLHKADAVAAAGVAMIVIYISGKLGWRTVQALMETAPRDMTATIMKSASAVTCVVGAHAVGIRGSGPDWISDLHVTRDGPYTVKKAHRATEAIETAIRRSIPKADVTVHVKPAPVSKLLAR